MKRLRPHALFLVLLVVALVLRLYQWKHTGVDLYGDMMRYDAMAWHLVLDGYLGYAGGPDAYVTPGYPLFIAFLYKLSIWLHGGRMMSPTRMVHEVYLVQQMLSLVTLAGIYTLGTLLRNRAVGLWAAVLTLLYLPNGFVGMMLLTEALFIPLLIGTLTSFVYAQKTRSGWAYGMTGLLLGLTTLVRPTVLPLLVIFIALDVWQRFTDDRWRFRWRDQDLLRKSLWMIVPLVVVMIPWWIRNAIDFHQLILLSTESGNPFLAGADPYFLVNIDQLIQNSRLLHESQQAYGLHYLLQGLLHHFSLFAGWYLFGKLPYLFWTPWLYAYVKLLVLYQRVLVVLGAIAMLATLGNSHVRVLAWTSLFILIVQLAFMPTERYGYPIIVLWTILIPIFADVLWTRMRPESGVRF